MGIVFEKKSTYNLLYYVISTQETSLMFYNEIFPFLTSFAQMSI